MDYHHIMQHDLKLIYSLPKNQQGFSIGEIPNEKRDRYCQVRLVFLEGMPLFL